MSDAKGPRPLFPPRPEEGVQTVVPPPPDQMAQRQGGVDLEVAGKIERTVTEIIMRRLAAQAMPYGLARLLIQTEAEIVGELVRQLAKAP
jgi:hypothetical protein